jgi:hypothetical protein
MSKTMRKSSSTQSGGINVDADTVSVGKDVIGRDQVIKAGEDVVARDKITNVYNITEPASSGQPKWVIPVIAAAVVLISVVVIVVLLGQQPSPQSSPAPQSASLPLTGSPGGLLFTVGALTWTTDDGNAIVDWGAADASCQGLGLGSSRWRLPTLKELQTIYDPNDADAFGSKLMRPFHDGVRSNYIWSSDKDTAASAFAFDFEKGDRVSLAVNFNQGAHALCVTP